ncbi:MAG: hypothetical protein GQE15_32465 [Archangiaceae bacterium]|nr:hypothetical protein [Archangiaceae bacterium]
MSIALPPAEPPPAAPPARPPAAAPPAVEPPADAEPPAAAPPAAEPPAALPPPVPVVVMHAPMVQVCAEEQAVQALPCVPQAVEVLPA